MDKIQIAFFFISGFFISRIVIKTEIPQRIASFLLHKRHSSLPKIIFYLIALSAFLSFFVPNVITILTLLPLVNIIIDAYNDTGKKVKLIPTILALAIMYGANIGGMGSITATPANGILITFIGLNNVAGADNLSFASWLLWGIPLVIGYVGLAWIVLVSFFHPGKNGSVNYDITITFKASNHIHFRLSVILTILYFISSFVFSLLIISYPEYLISILIITGIYTIIFVVFIFFYPLKTGNSRTLKEPLLKLSDCYSNLPIKGFIYVGISVVIAGLLYLFNLHEPFSVFITKIIPDGLSIYLLFLFLALLTTFSTELISNTAIQLSLFIIILPLSQLLNFSPTEALIIITLSSTCAFMSPIATGVNGLAFGGVKNVSFKIMLLVGLVMNIVGAFYLSFYVKFIVSKFL
jgi:solute carrier family 13 (sodium-dependent dicarboxylate transporter), member 2/3/5